MKDYLLELASQQTNSYNKLNVMREYLQAYTIRILFEEGAFRTLAFIGGTALRFVYHLPRYSEDLDFSILKSSHRYSFLTLLNRLKKEFILAGYEIDISYNDQKTVQSAFLKFPKLQLEAGISSFPDQNISIKIEIDTNPPSSAQIQSHIINKYFPLSFCINSSSGLLRTLFSALFETTFCQFMNKISFFKSIPLESIS